MHILVFGDSTVWGAWDIEGGWVQRLRKILDKKHMTNKEFFGIVYNAGISGNTTEHLLGRFEFETKQRLEELEKGEDLIIIISIGGNDSAYFKNKNSNWISPEKFKENIKKLIELARKFSSKIIFVGLEPIDESKSDPLPWDDNISYKNEYIQNYNEIIKSICKNENIIFVEIFDEWVNQDYKKFLCDDGFHPNSEGHKKIFEKVKETLIKNKLIE
jgi:lysophospholipase L1-like esterase